MSVLLRLSYDDNDVMEFGIDYFALQLLRSLQLHTAVSKF